MRKRLTLSEGFWENVDMSGGPDACWPFKKVSKTRDLRGIWWFDGKRIYAPRVAYELTKGPLKQQALHTCDNSICCNPKHIYDGTQQQNIEDRVKRGRDGGHKRRGQGNGRAILTSNDVKQIRELNNSGISYDKLAKQYNVHKTTIAYAVRGDTWKELS